MSTLSQYRKFHNFLAPIFILFFLFVSITAILLAFKSSYSSSLYKNQNVGFSKSVKNWKSLDSLEISTTLQVNKKIGKYFKKSEKAEVKVEKGSLMYYFKEGIVVQVNGETGEVISIEKKYGGIIQDIHDGAILDSILQNKESIFKKIYSVLIGLAFLIMSITGIYLWYKPILIKNNKSK